MNLHLDIHNFEKSNQEYAFTISDDFKVLFCMICFNFPTIVM